MGPNADRVTATPEYEYPTNSRSLAALHNAVNASRPSAGRSASQTRMIEGAWVSGVPPVIRIGRRRHIPNALSSRRHVAAVAPGGPLFEGKSYEY